MRKEPRLNCPSCHRKGRRVPAVTPLSMLNVAADTLGPMRFCRSADCDVVYFDEANSQSFTTAEVKVLVYQKDPSPARLVCYCFAHSVESLEDEVRATGTSTVPESIANNCKAGLDDCEHNNPQGACCLGNVLRVLASAGTPARSPRASVEPESERILLAGVAKNQGVRTRREAERCAHLESAPRPAEHCCSVSKENES